jgi:DNA replication licensing factor MCM4
MYNTQVIWGTTVNVGDIQDNFSKFIYNFDDGQAGVEGGHPYYLRELLEIRETSIPTLNLNCEHLHEHNEKLYQKLVDYPADILPMFDLVANMIFTDLIKNQGNDFEEGVLPPQIAVRPFNLAQTQLMRSLGPNDIDRLVTIKGIVIRCTDVIPEMREATFKCHSCGFFSRHMIDRGRVEEPQVCTNCKTKGSFELIHNRCVFGDKQHIKLQENPE